MTVPTLFSLKNKGHELLEEYIALDRNVARPSDRARREHAYEKLGNRLGSRFGEHHFSRMKTEAEVLRAIRTLESMIKRRKKKNFWDSKDVTLPQAELDKIYRRQAI